ncbi:MAG: FkbM family methyltransferase [Candidatus Heimdallarchaeota archaeon]|nr:FkbM family methyltransferase [Candidatus Heimdallarchaeota archaeon]
MTKNILITTIKLYITHIYYKLLQIYIILVKRPSYNGKLTYLGTKYGGWFVPLNLLNQDSICYSFGIGEDVSFDISLIEQINCYVYGFDPTPRSIEFVHAQFSTKFPKFIFHPIGIWSADEEMKFYEPKISEHVSHSITNLQNTKNYFIANCKKLSTIMKELNHSSINLLKMDVEGAEMFVIPNIIEESIQIDIINVELDRPFSFRKVLKLIKQMENEYTLIKMNFWDLTFISNRFV